MSVDTGAGYNGGYHYGDDYHTYTLRPEDLAASPDPDQPLPPSPDNMPESDAVEPANQGTISYKYPSGTNFGAPRGSGNGAEETGNGEDEDNAPLEGKDDPSDSSNLTVLGFARVGDGGRAPHGDVDEGQVTMPRGSAPQEESDDDQQESPAASGEVQLTPRQLAERAADAIVRRTLEAGSVLAQLVEGRHLPEWMLNEPDEWASAIPAFADDEHLAVLNNAATLYHDADKLTQQADGLQEQLAKVQRALEAGHAAVTGTVGDVLDEEAHAAVHKLLATKHTAVGKQHQQLLSDAAAKNQEADASLADLIVVLRHVTGNDEKTE